MKLYLLNEYVGGTPFDSQTLGVYLSLDEAKEHLKKELETHNHENYLDEEDETKIITDTFFYFDCDDWWGGCEIQEIETKFKLTK
tara:strand:+ start:602 stop:856 length:255 start_codon:yes stop_codon:yes gene_type:complete